jgi:hypothetical protein
MRNIALLRSTIDLKPIKLAGACFVAAVLSSAAFAPASDASVPSWGFQALLYASFPASANHTPLMAATNTTPLYMNPLVVRETAVLTRQGLSPASASRAIAVQSEVARADLVRKTAAAMAGGYAGVWFEPTTAQLHIGVTSPAGRRAAEAVAARAGLAADVTETPVRSTWARLLAAQRGWNRKLQNLFAREEVQTALAPQDNAVSISLSSTVPSTARAALQRQASAANTNVFIVIVPSSQLRGTPAACNKFTTKKAYCDKPLTSGVTIESSLSGGKTTICTAGPLAVPKANKSETYMLTAGHCVDNGGSEWFAFTTAAVKKKIGDADKFQFSEAGDYGDVLIEPEPAGFWAKAGNDPISPVIAQWEREEPEILHPVVQESTPTVKTINCHAGQTSGESCGEIKALNQSLTYEGEKVDGLVKAEGAELKGLGGDSGGPWYSKGFDDEALMEGIFVATAAGNEKIGYFEPLETVFKDAAFPLELLTTSNEVRPGCG